MPAFDSLLSVEMQSTLGGGGGGARRGKRAPLKNFTKAANATASGASTLAEVADFDSGADFYHHYHDDASAIAAAASASASGAGEERALLLFDAASGAGAAGSALSSSEDGSSHKPATVWARVRAALCGGDASLAFAPRSISFDGERVGPSPSSGGAVSFPANVVRNQKYSVLSFVPVVLFNQFRFFFNFYFLLVAMTQFVPVLQVGFLFTYIAPLAFVLSITMLKEAIDDFARYRRDAEANSTQYARLTRRGTTEAIAAADIRVGDILRIGTNQVRPPPRGFNHSCSPPNIINSGRV